MELSKNKHYIEFIDKPDKILSQINPINETKSQPELRSSDKLAEGLADGLLKYESHFEEYRNEIDDELDGLKLDSKINLSYLSLFAYNSQDKSRSLEERQKWADYFTEQSVVIYGAPDAEVVNRIERGEAKEMFEEFQPIFTEVKDWLNRSYAPVFAALETGERTDKLTVDEVYGLFTDGLDALKAQDPRFEDWSVNIKPGASVLSCDADEKSIKIGEKRAKMAPAKLKGLFAHEVLRHAMTAVNGEDLGINSALPQYINTEEGFAKIYELSTTGEFPQMTMDNYSDIGWCLGQIDGKNHTRSELIERKLQRKASRNENVTDKTVKTAESQAARIFRGTPGSEEVSGVFTKDISYFEGLVPGLKYIKNRLDAGDKIDEIMAFASAAKFNLYDEDHQNYIKQKIMGKYAIKSHLLLPAPEENLQ